MGKRQVAGWRGAIRWVLPTIGVALVTGGTTLFVLTRQMWAPCGPDYFANFTDPVCLELSDSTPLAISVYSGWFVAAGLVVVAIVVALLSRERLTAIGAAIGLAVLVLMNPVTEYAIWASLYAHWDSGPGEGLSMTAAIALVGVGIVGCFVAAAVRPRWNDRLRIDTAEPVSA